LGFDLNKRAEFITRLKIAAIKTLNYEEFLMFFGKNRQMSKLFDYVLYRKIKTKLDIRTTKFFDKLYKEFRFKGGRLASSQYFRRRRNSAQRTKLINGYLQNETTYMKLRNILAETKFRFIKCGLEELSLNKNLRKKKFDIINISNVPDYITGLLQKQGHNDPFKYFVSKIIIPIFKLISSDGLIFYFRNSPRVYMSDLAPPAAESYEINRAEFKKDFKITDKRIIGIFEGTRDHIVIFKMR
jgi:hypothetical protein